MRVRRIYTYVQEQRGPNNKKIQSSDIQAGDQFGESVSINSNYAIVGAWRKNSSIGAVYIFERSGTTWTEVKKITASDAQADDNFGYSVAIDGTNVFVGARDEDTKGSDAGAVYIFDKSTIAELKFDNYNKLSLTNTPTNTSSKLFLGSNVYDIGTLTSDLTIETPGLYKGLVFDTSSNVAYFNKTTVGAIASTMASYEKQDQVLDAGTNAGYSNGDASQGGYGNSIDMSADGTRMVVGNAHYTDSNGRVWLYHLENGLWVLKQTWDGGTRLGSQVVMNEAGTRAFALYTGGGVKIWDYSSGAWDTSASGTYSITPGTISGEVPGVDCNKAGDVVIIGSGNSTNTWIYRLSGGSWSSEKNFSRRGSGVSMNGAGTRCFMGDRSSHKVWESNYSGGSWGTETEIIEESSHANYWPIAMRVDSAGETLCVHGNHTGSPGKLYERAGNGSWSASVSDIRSNNEIYGSDPPKISYDGTLALFHSYYNNVGSDYYGRVTLYSKSGSTWSILQTINDPNEDLNDYFGDGTGLAKTAKDRFVIAATGDDNAGTNYGAIYTYTNAIPDFISFDTYNKLSLSGLTNPTSKIHALPTGAESTTTYDIGTATNIYIESAGTYTAEMKGSSAFALDSNVVGGTISSEDPIRLHWNAYSSPASDSSGNSLTGTLNSVSDTSGAFTFDGSSSYIQLSTSDASDAKLQLAIWDISCEFYKTGSGTVGSWVDANAIVLITKGINAGDGGGYDINYGLVIDSNNKIKTGFEEAGSNQIALVGTTTISNNQWYTARSTFDGTNLKVYLNGVLENSVTTTLVPASNDAGPLMVGAGRYTTSNTPAAYFQGRIKNVKINKFINNPSLNFDTYNKYTFTGADTGSTYKLKYESNTYDLGTISNVYIANAGTYSAEIKGATNFALSSNVTSGTITPYKVWKENEDHILYASDAAASDHFGTSVAIRGDYAISSSYSDDGEKGSAYIFYKSGGTWTQQTKLVASDAAGSDRFGWSVAIDGDYAIIGSERDDDPTDSGSAYIFKRSGTSWTQQSKLTASDAAATDYFGYSVGISGDYAIVGAWKEDAGGTDAGAAYIFKGTTTTSSTVSEHPPSALTGTETGGGGGYKVTSSSDAYNNTGFYNWKLYNKILINEGWHTSAIFNSTSPHNYSGSASLGGVSGEWNKLEFPAPFVCDYVILYSRDASSPQKPDDWVILGSNDDSNWTQLVTTTTVPTTSGLTVQISDTNSYKYFAIVIKSTHSSQYCSIGELKYFGYMPSLTTWSQQQKILSSDIGAGDQFGISVDIDGEYTIIGANYEDTGGSNAGSAYIFKRGQVLSSITYPTSAMTANSSSGCISSSSSNLSGWESWKAFNHTINNEGWHTNGGNYDSSNGNFLGNQPYSTTYDGSSTVSGEWIQIQFSSAISIVGINIAPRSPPSNIGQYEDRCPGDGRILGSNDGSTWTSITTFNSQTYTGGSYTNITFAASSSYTYFRLVVTKLSGNDATVQCGEIQYVAQGSLVDVWSQQQKIMSSDIEANDQFGRSVSLSGDYTIVSAHLEDTGATSVGAAYVYKRDGTTWTQEFKFQASDKQDSDKFGKSVSISGNRVVVGAQLEDTGGSNAGAAYIFERSGTTWTEVKKITASGAGADDYFGQTVAIDGTNVIVGARGEDTKGSNAGAAYVYEKVNVLDFDGYNKLTFTGLESGSTSNVTFDGNTYSIGTASNVYIENTGTYEAESKGTTTFALTSKAATVLPTSYIAFHYAGFVATDYNSAYSTKEDAAADGFVYADTPDGTYSWGTLTVTSNTTSNTQYTWTAVTAITADVLTVAGGGGGGGHVGGGGGAGGLLFNENISLSGQKTIVVGSGGDSVVDRTRGLNGNDTYIDLMYTVAGGGGGGSYTGVSAEENGLDGGSGGGGTHAGTGGLGLSGQGNSGGDPVPYNTAGGGGGAGDVGETAPNSTTSGDGGIGVNYSGLFLSYGDDGWFASGGGGGARNGATAGTASIGGGANGIDIENTPPSPAKNHTGGGGGGGYSSDGVTVGGSSGGSGIVIIRSGPRATSPSLTHDGYKLVVKNITPTSTTLKYESNTYEIGTATNIYVENTGDYSAEIGNATDFALTSNTVSGTIKTIEPGFASRYQGSMALTYDGKLYAWGMNDDGEAGVGTSSDITVPTLCTGITQGTVAKLLSSSDLTDNSRGEVSAIKTTRR